MYTSSRMCQGTRDIEYPKIVLRILDGVGLSWTMCLCNIAWTSGAVPLAVPLFQKRDGGYVTTTGGSHSSARVRSPGEKGQSDNWRPVCQLIIPHWSGAIKWLCSQNSGLIVLPRILVLKSKMGCWAFSYQPPCCGTSSLSRYGRLNLLLRLD